MPPPPSPLRCCRPQHLRLGRRSLHRVHFAATWPPPSIDQGTAAAVGCGPAPHTPAQPLPQPRTLACTSHAHLTCEGLQAMVRGSVGGQREGVGTAAADEKAAHVAQQPAWGGHWPWAATSCAGACARCSAEEASCDAALARAQRVELLAEQPAQTALASRCAGALSRRTQRGTSGRKIEARFGAQLRSGGTTRCIPVRV